jgi:hypothetical protein
MKTLFSEAIEDTARFNDTAADRTWQQKRLARLRARSGSQSAMLGEIATILLLGIAFCALLLLTQAPPAAPVTAQSFELPARPIWINNLSYAPRDGHSLEITPSLPRDLGDIHPTR